MTTCGGDLSTSNGSNTASTNGGKVTTQVENAFAHGDGIYSCGYVFNFCNEKFTPGVDSGVFLDKTLIYYPQCHPHWALLDPVRLFAAFTCIYI